MRHRLPIYDTATGRIMGVVRCDAEDVMIQGGEVNGVDTAPLMGAPADAEPDTHYVFGGAAVPRPTLPDLPAGAAMGVPIVVAGFPVGSAVRVALGPDEVEGGVDAQGVLEIQFDEPGAWRVHVEPPFPAMPRSYSVGVA